MKAADRLAGAGSFGAISRTSRSERGRAKAIAEGTIPTYEIQRLPLSAVALCPMNPRRSYGTEADREQLGHSLATKQLTACVAVTRAAYLRLWPAHEELLEEQAEYVLLNGERRTRSAAQVGLDSLDFVVRDDLATSQADFMDYLMAENEDRADFNIMERALGLKQLLDACGGVAAEVARRRGRDRSWVGNQIALLTLPTAIQARLANGEMAERYGRRLARAYKDDLSLSVDDLLAMEQQLKDEERTKRVFQQQAVRMLSADNTAEAPEYLQTSADERLSTDNTTPESESVSSSISRPPLGDDTPLHPSAGPTPVPRREPVLSADNTHRANPVPRQTAERAAAPAVSPADLVRALGTTVDEQAKTLKEGLDPDTFVALVEALHTHV
ncbi:ParB/RepB/Spo0J family partition protein [Kitasatospora purpeofusca]|uniref:ParB/RepB/Spo0J family partition protein n=1 Tax=Kitasatospora purpeofusca TaxID=67352 RepID=UPI00365B4725